MTYPYHGLAQLKRARRRSPMVVGIGMASFLFSLTANAQDTRTETIHHEQADRQKQLTPPRLNGVERLLDRLEDWGMIGGDPRGFYPWFGSVYPGGGFAGGAGFRRPFGDDGALNILGGYSIGNVRSR